MIIRKLICGIILLTSKTASWTDKLNYYLYALTTFTPVVALSDYCSLWFNNNKQFALFLLFNLILNMGVGIWVHRRLNTFKWEDFLTKNIYMALLIFISYSTIEMLRLTAGENSFTLVFKSVIEVSTLLYPASKILKNIYILSNKKIPHPFIMERLYRFEKTGKLDDIFGESNNINNKEVVEPIEVTNP